MKKPASALVFMILAVFLLSNTFFSSATSVMHTEEISYGIEILKNKTLLKKSAPSGATVAFSPDDFQDAFGIKSFSHIKITSLPDISLGVLKLGGIDVIDGQTVSRENVSYLKFIPRAASVSSASFSFSDATGISSRELICSMKFSNGDNASPTGSDGEFSTYKNVTLYGRLSATDSDGDALSFEAVSAPDSGILTVYGDGSFCYRPISTFTGRDSFDFRATDALGNSSEILTARVSVLKSYKNVFFTDMSDHWAHADAISMVKNGIIDISIGDNGLPVFSPSSEVTRGEFLIMAMKTAGLDRGLADVAFTDFADDGDIPYSMKKYVASAVQKGIIKGVDDGESVYFRPHDLITRAQAAVIINRILDLPSGESVGVFADSAKIPAWAEKSLGSLVACGIISGTGNGILNPDGIMTNAQTATLLNNVLEWIKK